MWIWLPRSQNLPSSRRAQLGCSRSGPQPSLLPLDRRFPIDSGRCENEWEWDKVLSALLASQRRLDNRHPQAGRRERIQSLLSHSRHLAARLEVSLPLSQLSAKTGARRCDGSCATDCFSKTDTETLRMRTTLSTKGSVTSLAKRCLSSRGCAKSEGSS